MEHFRRRRPAPIGWRSRLPGILLMLGASMLCIAVILPALAPIPADLEPLNVRLASGSSGSDSSLQYIDGGGVLDLAIEADGKHIKLRTEGGTVRDALSQAGLELGERDRINCELEDEVYAGMQLKVTRVTSQPLVKDVVIYYDTEEIPNDRMMVGTEIVLTEGVNGSLRETWEVEYHDGVEVSRKMTGSTVTKEPTTAVIEVGSFVLPAVNEEAKTLTFGDGKVLNYRKKITVGATAYSCEGKRYNITATGTTARVGAIAVDPRVIPLNSKLYVQAPDGTWFYGICTAEDTGGKIKGKRIDLYYDTIQECVNFGYRQALVYIIEEE